MCLDRPENRLGQIQFFRRWNSFSGGELGEFSMKLLGRVLIIPFATLSVRSCFEGGTHELPQSYKGAVLRLLSIVNGMSISHT